MATTKTKTLNALAREYEKITKAEDRREDLYARIVEIVESGEATGAEVARALGLQRQRIYQIIKEHGSK